MKINEPSYNPPDAKLKIDLDFVTGCPKVKLYDKSNGTRGIINVEPSRSYKSFFLNIGTRPLFLK